MPAIPSIPWTLPALLAAVAAVLFTAERMTRELVTLARRPKRYEQPTRLSAARGLIAGNPLLVLIAGIGFSLSFQTISSQAHAHGLPGWSPLYPILIDLGILALVIEARHAIDDDRSDLVPRVLAWVLSAFTIYVNAHGSPANDWLGRVLHVVAPCMWVAFLELTRWRKLRKVREGKSDRIPRARWLADWPHRTLGMKRRMVLNNVTSYPVACAREEARMLATDLARAEWGSKWKRDAPPLFVHQVRNGTFPGDVSRVAELAAIGTSPAMADPVAQWVTDAATERDKAAAKVRRERRQIERQADEGSVATEPRQNPPAKSRQKSPTERDKTRVKVSRLLAANPDMPLPAIADRAGVHVRTVQRIKTKEEQADEPLAQVRSLR